MPAARTETMSRVDTAWLRMDNDVNRMVIVGVWLLQPGIAFDALARRIRGRLLKYGRFRQKVVEDALGARWVRDDRFDLARHLVRHTLRRRRAQSERDALQELVGRLATTPLDRAHPLWQFHFIEHYDGGSALVARVHHCIADGIALVAVMLSITDGGHPPAARRGRDDPDGEGWLDAVLHPVAEWASRPVSGSLSLARAGYRLASDVAALVLMPDDSPTALKGRPVGRKKVAWSEPFALDEVKAVGKALGCSVNDVLLSCVAGALGAALRAAGDDPSGKEIRAMVPVNLRASDEAGQLGNRFGLVPLVLPIGVPDPVERLLAVRERMRELKGSFQPVLAFAVLAVAGLLVKPAQDALLDLFARKTTAVMTNVPGPRHALRLCGATLRQAVFWVPQSGAIGVGLSILSYAGGVQFALMTDERLWSDPQAIIDRFQPEFERLLLATLMLPWGDPA